MVEVEEEDAAILCCCKAGEEVVVVVVVVVVDCADKNDSITSSKLPLDALKYSAPSVRLVNPIA